MYTKYIRKQGDFFTMAMNKKEKNKYKAYQWLKAYKTKHAKQSKADFIAWLNK